MRLDIYKFTLLVIFTNEIYSSEQGEGTNIGKKCVFLRLSHCNLKCSWCDTPYSWDWKNYDIKKESHSMGIESIYNEISKFGLKHLVITGGEPLLQQLSIIELLKKLGQKWYVEIETNGTIIPKPELINLVDQFNFSPKLTNSGADLKEIYKKTIPELNKIKQSWFKFVIDEPNDLKEIDDKIDKKKIILMPQATTKEEILKKGQWINKYCIDKGYLFSTRDHILKYGKMRGV